MIFQAVLVGIGGALGAICRYIIGQRLNPPTPHFPYGTFLVNLIGALLLGWMVGARYSGIWTLLLGTGFLGAFTTFSTFKWESIQLWHNKKRRETLLYIGLSYTLGIFLAFVGYLLGVSIR